MSVAPLLAVNKSLLVDILARTICVWVDLFDYVYLSACCDIAMHVK